MTGLGGTLLGQDGSLQALFAALVFAIGICACVVGRAAISKAHEYYRKSIYKKTLIEDQLGLLKKVPGYTYAGANFSVATAAGMHSFTQVLHETEQWLGRPERTDSLVWVFRTFLAVVAIIDLAGLGIALWVALA